MSITFATPDQDVVLGVWDLVFGAPADELDAVVDSIAGAITGPYLSLHGIDPGPDYDGWLTSRIPSATVEVWSDLGHYPHLIEPDRFVARVVEFDSLMRQVSERVGATDRGRRPTATPGRPAAA